MRVRFLSDGQLEIGDDRETITLMLSEVQELRDFIEREHDKYKKKVITDRIKELEKELIKLKKELT